MGSVFIKSAVSGESVSLRAYGYEAEQDEGGRAWPARVIIGFGCGGVSADSCFIGAADARAFAAEILEMADRAEGVGQ